jgi:UDPglucose 6-dehydrogenase
VRTATDAASPLRLIETTVEVNDARKKAMADKIAGAMGGDVSGKTVAILGLTFKPDTDDMRDSPSLDIVPALQALGARIQAYDPEGMEEARKLLPEVEFLDGPYEAAAGAHALVLLTEWNAFRALDLDRIKLLMAAPVVVDLRNVYDPAGMKAAGFTYASVGRPEAAGASGRRGGPALSRNAPIV